MYSKKLILYTALSENIYRAIIKTKHGRLIYLEIKIIKNQCNIVNCYYIDRIRNKVYYAQPQKLITLNFDYDNLLNIIETELDSKYCEIEINDLYKELSTEEFIQDKLQSFRRKYNFLIMIGEGETVNDIPSILKTRFKNRIHRSIYIELHYRGNGKGVIADCRYYDRIYKSKQLVIPETLTSIIFEYNRNRIIQLINNELNADFTDVIFITDNSVDINNTMPLCGNI